MNKKLSHKNNTIQYTIQKNKRSKCMRISVQMGGFVQVTKPTYVSDKEVERFVHEKRDWILEKMSEFKKYGTNRNLFVDDREHFLKHKERAQKFCEEKVAYWNRNRKFPVNDIRVKRVRSMWGSCSSQGNLNFNYKILFVPEKVADSIVVHELCHLKEMNHSPRFWRLVDEVLCAG